MGRSAGEFEHPIHELFSHVVYFYFARLTAVRLPNQ